MNVISLWVYDGFVSGRIWFKKQTIDAMSQLLYQIKEHEDEDAITWFSWGAKNILLLKIVQYFMRFKVICGYFNFISRDLRILMKPFCA